MKNLLIRALTGIVFVAVIVGAICIYPISFMIIFGLITLAILWEFYGLVEHYDNKPLKRFLYSLAGMYLFCASFAYAQQMIDGVIFLPYLFFLICIVIAELYYKDVNPIKNWALTFFAQFYCAGSFSLLAFISTISDGGGGVRYYPYFVLAIFVFVWLNDTGAYLVGSLLGKHRLFERISPKKSWEGFWGGFVVAVAASQIFAHYIPQVSWYIWLGFAIVVVVFGTFGDLVESLMKRTLEVKDSGRVLPGHGGMLDRFDSVLLAVPAAYIYMELFIRN